MAGISHVEFHVEAVARLSVENVFWNSFFGGLSLKWNNFTEVGWFSGELENIGSRIDVQTHAGNGRR